MKDRPIHFSDEELLLHLDREASSALASHILQHLSECQSCSVRLTEIEETMEDVTHLHRESTGAQTPSAVHSRALLTARMRGDAAMSGQAGWLQRLPALFFRPPLAYAGVGFFLMLLAVGIRHYRSDEQSNNVSPIPASALLIPNRNLTPGAIRPVTRQDICTAGHRDMNRAVPIPVQQEVFQKYGLVGVNPRDYEIDYLITPELGGSSDIRNLWPESYSSTEWNAHVKDVLENRFHELVCDGEIDLATAQSAMATDWVSAYKKYFQTERPLPAHSSGV